MCLIIFAREGRTKPEYIDNANFINSDGIGVSWRENGYLRYEKNITLEQAKDYAATLPLGHCLHFRMASIGGVSKNLVHPFPVRIDVPLQQKGKATKLLFHNGHWTDWNRALLSHLSNRIKLPSGEWSDSRALAMLTAIHGRAFLDSVVSAGKFALFTPKKAALIGHWVNEDGVFYSHGGYKNSGYRYPSVSYGDDYDYRYRTNESVHQDERYKNFCQTGSSLIRKA